MKKTIIVFAMIALSFVARVTNAQTTPPPFAGTLTSQTDLTGTTAWINDPWYTTGGTAVPGNNFGPTFGTSKLDAVFGTTSFRPPATTDFPAAGGCVTPNTQGLVVDYSKVLPQSRDGLYFLFPDTCGNDYLFQNTGTTASTTFLRRIQIDSVTNAFATNGFDFISDDSDWTFSQDAANPDFIYYVGKKSNTGSRNELKRYNILTNTSTVIFDFSTIIAGYPGANSVDNGREGNPSEDDRYWMFYVQNDGTGVQQAAIIYDRTANTVIANKTLAAGGLCGTNACGSGKIFNWTGVCGDGTTDYFIGNFNNIASRPWTLTRGAGTEVYDINLSFLGFADYKNSHADCGKDKSGNWVYVTADQFEQTHFDVNAVGVVNLANVSPTPPATNNPIWAGLRETGLPCLWSFLDTGCITPRPGAPQSYTISMRGSHGTQQGIMIFSNFFDGTSLAGLGGWGAVENDAIMIDWNTASTLGGTGVAIPIGPFWRINRCHAIDSEYFTQCDGVPNWDATRIFYTSSGDVDNGSNDPPPNQMVASQLSTANHFYHFPAVIQLPIGAAPVTGGGPQASGKVVFSGKIAQ